MESWLRAVDREGRHAGSYIQVSTRNHENDGKKHNHGWVLYSVYAVLSVYAVHGVGGTRCELMVMAWGDREG